MTNITGIVDAIFVRAERMFRAKFYFYIFTFLVPFAFHFFFAKWTAFVLLTVSAVSLLFLTFYEYIQIKHEGFTIKGFKAYMDFNNFVDLIIVPIHCLLMWLTVVNKY
jgi:hypothetical protein